MYSHNAERHKAGTLFWRSSHNPKNMEAGLDKAVLLKLRYSIRFEKQNVTSNTATRIL
jgi:hypothetical protein